MTAIETPTGATTFSGEQLMALRRKKGLNREQLAAALGSSLTSVVGWEKNRIRPTVTSVGRLADALGCSASDLFTRR